MTAFDYGASALTSVGSGHRPFGVASEGWFTSTKPRLLDLFCGAGGAAMGYHRAGFEVVGVDIEPQPRYPFEFYQHDALKLFEGHVGGRWHALGRFFDAIHASPPCQDHSVTQNFTTRQHGSGWMLAATREKLEASGVPWVIENVPGAPMRADFKLCGCMFRLPRLKRERWFETSWGGFELRPPCYHTEPVITVAGHDVPSHQRKFGRSVSLDERKAAMGIDWMGRDALGQAIPPAYTEHIGHYLLAEIKAGRSSGRSSMAEGQACSADAKSTSKEAR